jgi:peptidoglycan/xylan/chitin deacetylase (PgdA/CDA1 family)
MGAPARSWLNRGLLVLALAAGIGLVLWAPLLGAGAKAAILLVAAVMGGYGAFHALPGFDPLGRVHWRLPRGPGRVCALTFDDGPSASTGRVLEILARYQIKATFFVLAANARRHPEQLRQVVEQGHTVAIHGVTHQKLHHADEATIAREIGTAIEQLTALGAPPARLYRPPHGVKNRAVLRVTRQLGCQLWAWSRGIWDTDRPPPETLVKRATRFARSRMVLLVHDGRGHEDPVDIEPLLAALPGILETLRARGFTFATLDRA